MSTRRHRALLTALLSLAALHSARGAAEERAAAGVTAEPKSGQVEVTLAGVRTGVSGKDLRTTATGREPRWTRIDLRLMLDGAPSRLWLPQQVRIHGANGRSWVPTRVVSHFGRNGEGCIAFPDPQPRAESGWRFQLELARSSRYLPYEFWDVFRPSELWTVPLVEVPKPRKAEVANAHASTVMREGVRLKLVRMAGSRVPVPAGLAAKPRVPSLQVRYSPPLPGVNVTLLRATDFSGRLVPLVVPPIVEPAGKSDTERSILFALGTQKNARLVNATFAVHHSRYVELTAQPGPGPVLSAR